VWGCVRSVTQLTDLNDVDAFLVFDELVVAVAEMGAQLQSSGAQIICEPAEVLSSLVTFYTSIVPFDELSYDKPILGNTKGASKKKK